MNHPECYKKDYPRPQFVRDSFLNLNGIWRFAFDHKNEGEHKKWQYKLPGTQCIEVPFAYQTFASGIGKSERCDNVWYERTFLPDLKKDERLFIHLEGCDHVAKVWLNGVYLGSHSGAYTRASFEATHAVVEGENRLTIKAEDSYSCRQPRGKQRSTDNSYTCWYIDTTGVWKTVWAEKTPATYLKSVHITPNIDTLSVLFEGEINGDIRNLQLCTEIKFAGKTISKIMHNVIDERVSIMASVDCEAHFFSDMLWSGRDPHLYDVTFTLLNKGMATDTVRSYFGMVKYRAEKNSINVNDSPVYLKMLLDQGYWKDSHLTPPNEEAIEKDILLTLQAGFNGIRKHQKIEDERFYYYCDVLGIYVWCEMPSMYEFCDESISTFLREWQEVVEQMRNHPCIMAYVPFNESWGINRIHSDRRQQTLTEAVYFLTKTLDPTRLVISNDGWDHTRSDIITLHHYAEKGEQLSSLFTIPDVLENKITNPVLVRHAFAEGYKYTGQPVVISEYGGIAFSKDSNRGWGYGNLVQNEEEFLCRLSSLTQAIKNMPGVCGYCLTQTTDVQQEVNGILTEDRQWKANITKLREINGENNE